MHTPRRCGEPLRAGVLFLLILSVRPLRTSCWIVGTGWYLFPSGGFGIPWLCTPPSLRRDHRCPSLQIGSAVRTPHGQTFSQQLEWSFVAMPGHAQVSGRTGHALTGYLPGFRGSNSAALRGGARRGATKPHGGQTPRVKSATSAAPQAPVRGRAAGRDTGAPTPPAARKLP